MRDYKRVFVNENLLFRNGISLNQKTSWYILTRICAEMAKKGGVLLEGIIEANETYIGGKPPQEKQTFR